MPCGFKIFFLALLLVALAFFANAQDLGLRESVTLTLTSADSAYTLPHQFIIGNTETVVLDSVRKLERNLEYRISYRYGSLVLLPVVLQLIRSDSIQPGKDAEKSGAVSEAKRHTVHITYQYLPLQFKDSYYRREIVVRNDTATGKSVQVAVPSKPLTLESIFGSELQRSGSIVRGFTLGSNRELSLSSGFRLQFSGKISSEIEVVAALTDENTPIQPEGNTLTLQEIDKVFVQLKSPNFGATLGDFNLELKGSEFGRFSRKLQGAKGEAEFEAGSISGKVVAVGAVTRGKFTTNQFLGIEGVQGPYRLTGRNGEREIIVVAGTEKVYVDGETMTRGETNDYVIEYGSGEITFTPKRLINSASRITVDFEYSDRRYTRTLAVGKIEQNLLNDKMKIEASYMREGDDYDSPIDISLSDEDRAILQQAGDDRLKASKTWVSYVGRDSLTNLAKGQYVRIDTLFQGDPYQYFRYSPGDTGALYSVGFSSVGQGHGDYVRESIGRYRWVGAGQGSYQPVQLLPLPQLHQVAVLNIEAKPADFLDITGEYALSSFDANRLSTLGEENANGNAFKFAASLVPKELTIGDVSLGSVGLTLSERFLSQDFNPIDRIDDIEFNRKWNIIDSSRTSEEIREARLSYQPVKALRLGAGYGWIERGSAFNSDRGEIAASLSGEGLPKADYSLEFIKSKDNSIDIKGSWIRQKGLIEYTLPVKTIWRLVPGFRYEAEERNLNSMANDSLKDGSFRFTEFAPKLSMFDFLNMTISAEVGIRLDDVYNSGSLVRQSSSVTQTYSWRLNEWKSLSSSLDVGIRKKKFEGEFRLMGNSDVETMLMKWQTRYSPFNRGVDIDLYYQVSTQRSARRQRVFFRVEKGIGNYIYLGDLNGNGIADENEFQLTRFDGDYITITVPTEQLFPVIDLKTSARFRLRPSRFIPKPETFLEDVLSAISTETYLRVEENSSEQDLKKIYLLDLERFQNDSTTIQGSNIISQDVFLFENSPELALRLRFNQRRGFNQFSSGNERRLNIERSVRIRWHLVQEISDEINILNKVDGVSAPLSSGRSHDILSNVVSSDLSYRPEQNIEVGFKLDVGKSVDRYPATTGGRETQASLNSESLRMTFSFETRGRARFELERDEVLISNPPQYVPFELTNGAVVGRSWLWRVGVDYRFGSFVQATLNYDGRIERDRSPVHTARAEVRAFF